MSADPQDPSSDRALYDDAPCGLVVTTAGGQILRVNRTFCTWLGVSADEAVGKKRLQDFFTAGSKLFHQTHWMPLLALQGSVAEVQLELVHTDGRVMPMLVNAVQHGEGAARTHHVALFVAADRRKYERELLLARRRAEELSELLREGETQFRTLAENSPDIIARVDRARRVVYVNPALERMVGIPHPEFLARTVDELPMPAAVLTQWSTAIDAAFSGREVEFASELERPSGEVVQLRSRVVPEHTERGELATVLTLTHDITALKQKEQDARERAVFAEQLVGIVSHDLRSPLNAIVLGGSFLSTQELSSAQGRAVARMNSAAARATRLIGDLLDFTLARLGGGLRVHPVEVDIHALVAECIDELHGAWPGRSIEHQSQGSGRAVCDPERVAQVISNLSNNALTYGSPQRPIVVCSRVTSGALELSVHNAGDPIPPALLPTLFEPLRRGEQKAPRGSRSVGLGLYIVREIALAHGGQVVVRSSAEEGTTFTVTLPSAATAQ